MHGKPRGGVAGLLCAAALLGPAAGPQLAPSTAPILIQEDFETGLGAWQSSAPAPSQATTHSALLADDFEAGFAGWSLTGPVTITEGAFEGSGALLLDYAGDYASATRAFSPTTALRARIYFYDNGDASLGTYFQLEGSGPPTNCGSADSPVWETPNTALGVRTDMSGAHYVVRLNCPGPAGANGTFAAEERRPDGTLAPVARRVGWHLFELYVTPTGTYARIDDREIDQHNAAQTDASAVALGSTWNLAGQAVYDHLLIEGGYQGPTSLVLNYADADAPVGVWRAFGPSTNVLARALFYDTLDESLGTMMTVVDESAAWQTGLGVLSSLSAQNYVLRVNTLAQTVDTGVRRSAGWHLFEIIVTDRGAFAKIDNQLLAQANAGHTSAAGVRFDATWGLTGEALYDGLLVAGADSAAWQDQLYTPLAIHYQRYSSLVPPDDGLVFAALYPSLGYCAPGADPRTCGLHSNDLRSVMSSALAWQRYGQQTGDAAAMALARRAFLEGWLNAPWKRSAEEPWRACVTGQEPCQDVDNWSRGAVMRMMVYAAYALWPALDAATQEAVALDLYAQAGTYAARLPESGYVGDTKAEENGWHAAFLAAVVNLIPAPAGDDPATLEARARCFAYHTITVAGDGPYCGVETQTVWDDWHVENHNQPSALYAAGALTFLGEGAISYRLAGRPIPYEFMHNVRPLFEAYQTHVDPDTYDHIGVPPDWAGAHDSAFSSPTVYRFMDMLGVPTGHSWPDYLTKRSLFYHDLASTWSKKAPEEVRVEVWNQIDQTEDSYHFFLDSLDAGEFYAFATFSLTLPPYLPERLYLPALGRQP